MNGENFSYFVNSIAVALSQAVSNDELTLLACVLVQLSDTLITIQTLNQQQQGASDDEDESYNGLPI